MLQPDLGIPLDDKDKEELGDTYPECLLQQTNPGNRKRQGPITDTLSTLYTALLSPKNLLTITETLCIVHSYLSPSCMQASGEHLGFLLYSSYCCCLVPKS